MSAYETTINNVLDSDARFQAWVQATEAAFLASGFLEVAPDTGQINPATIAKPSVSSFAGYRVYRAKDALAATKPLYCRIDYGLANAGRGSIKRITGTGSNGSGTLTGAGGSMGSSQSTPSSDGSGTERVIGGGGEASAWFQQNDAGQSSHHVFLWIGRLISPVDGSPQSPVTFDFFTTSSSVIAGSGLWTDGAISWASMSQGLASHLPDLSGSIQTGGNVSKVLAYQPLVYRNGETLTFPMVHGKPTEFPFTDPASSQFAMNIWGGSHNFLPLLGNGPLGGRYCALWE
jgi:hypothetical protein